MLNQRLSQKGGEAIANELTPFMLTPVVIAMPEPMAKALGYPRTPIGFTEILDLARNAKGWGDFGHPEWGEFRLGKTNELMVREPGLRFLIPVIDRPVKVDLRETLTEVPSQTTITKDNAPINVDFLVYWRIADPLKSVLASQRLDQMLLGVASTTLRAVIGDIPLDDVLAKREEINHILRAKLDEVTERWGVKITSVEIREIVPPRDIQDAMNRQMSAERNRRAVITESEGTRQATINVAEGDKQSQILAAEGRKEAAFRDAEARERQAEAEAKATSLVSEAISQGSLAAANFLVAEKYIDAIRALASAPAA